MWYGVSSIAARFIGYFLTIILTNSSHVKKVDFGKQSLLYAAIPVLSVLFSYGFETAYFRFSSRPEYKKSLYSTSFFSLLFTTILLSFILWQLRESLGVLVGVADIPHIIQLTILVIAVDTLAIIPFVKLRQEDRPVKYAVVRVLGIFVNLLLVFFFVTYCPAKVQTDPNSWVTLFFDSTKNPVFYVVVANLVQSVITFLLLGKEIGKLRFTFDTRLWKEMIIYSLPLLIVGFGGIINETFDRIMLKTWLPGTSDYRTEQVGIYNAFFTDHTFCTGF